jgi:phosphoserine phosphatase
MTMGTIAAEDPGRAAAPLFVLDARPASGFDLPLNMPLAVDCDGTLIRGDLFRMALLSELRRAPWRVVADLARWPLDGRAAVKARLAERAVIDFDRVRVRTCVVELIERERAAGRRVVLATAADERHATAMARALDLFDAVFASTATRNLKGATKAIALERAYPGGFIYAGDSAADLAVWARARAAVVVAARPAVVARVTALGLPTRVLETKNQVLAGERA